MQLKGTAPDFFVGLLRLDHVECGMLFRFPTAVWNFLSHLGFYDVSERMRKDPVLVPLPCYHVTAVDWSSSCGSNDLVAYNFTTGTVQGYSTEQIELVKRQKVDDGPVELVTAPTVDVNRLRGLPYKTFSELERDYRRCLEIVDDDLGQPVEFPADVDQPADFLSDFLDDLDDRLVQEACWEADSGSAFTADDRAVIITALARFSKTFLDSGFDLTIIVKGLANELEASKVASAEVEKNFSGRRS